MMADDTKPEPASPARDPARAASLMLVQAVSVLVFVGGRDAAIAALEGIIERIRGGAYREPAHPPGNA